MTAYLEEIREIGVSRLVVLRRLNLMRKITSTLMAQQRGRWHLPAGSSDRTIAVTVPEASLEIDGMTGTLVEHLHRISSWYQRADGLTSSADGDVLTLDCEIELMDDPAVGYERVLQHLALPLHPVTATTERLNTRPGEEVLTNHAQVAGWLAGRTSG